MGTGPGNHVGIVQWQPETPGTVKGYVLYIFGKGMRGHASGFGISVEPRPTMGDHRR